MESQLWCYPYKIKLTGHEKSIEQLMNADDRIADSKNADGKNLTAQDLQSCFLEIENKISKNVPEIIIDRIRITRKIATYGYFQWEFFTVSMLWSLSCIEMSLKFKYAKANPPPYLIKKKKLSITINNYWDLERLLHKNWQLKDNPKFKSSFRDLMQWAILYNLIPSNIIIHMQEIISSFNNHFAWEIFLDEAITSGLILSANPTIIEIEQLWRSLSEEEKKKYIRTNAEILALEIPNLRNQLAHGTWINYKYMPDSAINCYKQMIEIINCLWTRIDDQLK